MKKQKSLRYILVVAGLVVAYLILNEIFFQAQDSDDDIVYKELMDFAENTNKNCPFMVDEFTQLDGIVVSENRTIFYKYTLIGMNAEEVDVEYLHGDFKRTATNQAKTNPASEAFRKYRVTIKYDFKDSNGEHIAVVEVKPEDYID